MLIYIEKKIKDFPLSQEILQKFKTAQVLEIDHYKNIFDKKINNDKVTPAIIIAKLEHQNIIDVPQNYGYPGKSYFFKTSLNCIFNCEYCYLKGNFRNQYPVIFINYEDIQKTIKEKITGLRNEWYQWQITFYSSNYSDIQWLDYISKFNESFIPFFETFNNVLMEIRTKSGDIESLLKINNGIPYKNTEISFSLNPKEIIQKYEKWTASLDKRLQAIQTLLNWWYKVGLRFLPLLPIKNYEEIYTKFLRYINTKIDINKINSIFIASLIYNQWDFKQMQKKNPDSDLWNMVQPSENGLIKIPDTTFDNFKSIFQSTFPKKEILSDFT